MTEQEAKVFQDLGSTTSGKILVEYIQKLCTSLCDGRTWKDVSETERLGRIEAANILERELIKRLKNVNEPRSADNNQYI